MGFRIEIGIRLEAIIRVKRMRVDTVAEEANLSPSTVKNILKGKNYPSKPTLASLAKAVGTTMAWLAFGCVSHRRDEDTGQISNVDISWEEVQLYLNNLRTERGYTLLSLAEAADLDPRIVSDTLYGTMGPYRHLLPVAEALDITMQQVVTLGKSNRRVHTHPPMTSSMVGLLVERLWYWKPGGFYLCGDGSVIDPVQAWVEVYDYDEAHSV